MCCIFNSSSYITFWLNHNQSNVDEIVNIIQTDMPLCLFMYFLCIPDVQLFENVCVKISVYPQEWTNSRVIVNGI